LLKISSGVLGVFVKTKPQFEQKYKFSGYLLTESLRELTKGMSPSDSTFSNAIDLHNGQ
jgi:hypothetical protein